MPVRTRVGHSFIKQVMAETGAVFGGEHSGHYYFRENYRADSGLIAAVVVLERLSRSGDARCRRCWRRSAATTTPERSTTRVDDQAGQDRGDRRRVPAAAARTARTA